MISGCFSITGDGNILIKGMSAERTDGDLRFSPVEADGFTGGYFLHRLLPLSEQDIIWRKETTDILVLFSGYIYNRRELAARFQLDADSPEPLLAARLFLLEGPGFVSKLNGDFAIFICRPLLRQAYLFRDHIGIRPMAWKLIDDALIFSSDVKDLCRTVAAGKGPDPSWLSGSFRYIDLTRTPYPGVKKLLPGHYLEFSRKGTRLVRYWDPGKIETDRKIKYDDMLSDLRGLLADAVAIRCDSRFRAGAHVSSGLDSGIVAGLARKHFSSQPSFAGYSWSPGEFPAEKIACDERDQVRTFCSAAGLDPVFSGVTPDEFLGNVGHLFYNGGFFVEESQARKASSAGTNLIFSGWGGDEFISTGDRGIDTDLLRGLKLGIYFRRNPLRPLKRFARHFLEYTLFPALGILHPAVARSFEDEARYLKEPYKRSEGKAIRNFYFHTSRRQLHLRYLRFYHIQERCETWTVMGYRLGIEYRYPLLDRRIIEYMMRVPSELLCRAGSFRPLLRILGEGILPDDIRLNTGKKDHVFSAWWNGMISDSALSVMNEAGLWQANPDLSFVDFDLLEADINRYQNGQLSVDPMILFRALVYLKAVYQFSLEFRGEYHGTGE